MKSKTFIVLLIIFCMLAAAVYFNFSQKKRTREQQGISEPLFSSLPVTEISAITLNSDAGTVNLKKNASGWVVEGKFNYLADFTLITELVNKLKTSKIGRRFVGSADAISRLGLYLPDNKEAKDEEKGIRVTIKDNKDAILADVVIGKTRELTAGAGGHYIMPTSENTIYLVDKKFYDIGKTDSDWIKKDLLDIKEEEIEKVICYPVDEKQTAYTLQRPEKGKPPELVDVAPAEDLSISKIDDVFTALAPLTIDDVADYTGDFSETGITFAHRFEYHMFNGDVFDFVPGRTDDETAKTYYLKVNQQKEGTSQVKDARRKLIHQWVYVIPEWKYKRFIPNKEDLLK